MIVVTYIYICIQQFTVTSYLHQAGNTFLFHQEVTKLEKEAYILSPCEANSNQILMILL